MKLRRTLKFYSLKRGNVRQTWNKYNLWNLAKLQSRLNINLKRTFFQQKWSAKSLSRAYHGEHITETKWERMFSRRLLSVANMDPKYLAKYDGSEQATGTGSGYKQPDEKDASLWDRDVKPTERLPGSKLRVIRDEDGTGSVDTRAVKLDDEPVVAASEDDGDTRGPRKRGRSDDDDEFEVADPQVEVYNADNKITPYMSMTYAPQERRIDVAIHRAMFASSPRQARQFVIHGAVKVNGQVMTYSNYMLNPGDMFQVDPDMVMVATGRPKNMTNLNRAKKLRRIKIKALKAKIEQEQAKVDRKAEEQRRLMAAIEAAEAEEAKQAAEQAAELEAQEQKEQSEASKVSKKLKFLINATRIMLEENKDNLNVRKKRFMREFIKRAKAAQSKLGQKDADKFIEEEDLLTTIERSLAGLTIQNPLIADKAEKTGFFTALELKIARGQLSEETPSSEEGNEQWQQLMQQQQQQQQEEEAKGVARNSRSRQKPRRDPVAEAKKNLANQLRAFEENPIDETKPYMTPWKPREYLNPFAFIPRYLEVNQAICAAVYLRHPVARPGHTEVPSPFPDDYLQLVHNWYLRRR